MPAPNSGLKTPLWQMAQLILGESPSGPRRTAGKVARTMRMPYQAVVRAGVRPEITGRWQRDRHLVGCRERRQDAPIVDLLDRGAAEAALHAGPVQMREDAERHRLAPTGHQDRMDEAEHSIHPDRGGKAQGEVGSHAKGNIPPVGAQLPQEVKGGEEEGGDQPLATLS
jgi:hypothetical protein